MRALLATSLGVLSTATLVLPSAAAYAIPASGAAHLHEPLAASEQHLPGSTRSLPLTSTATGPAARTHAGDRAGAGAADTAPRPGADAELAPRSVRPFSLVGVVWQDAGERLDARVQVRTRSTENGTWSSWQTLQPHTDHTPPAAPTGPDGEERAHRGATAPLWVGRSDGVQARVRASGGELPRGLRLELVDPGEESAHGPGNASGERTADASAGGTRSADVRGPRRESAAAEPAMLPALTRDETVAVAERQGFAPAMAEADGEPHVGPRPGIVIRRGWGADSDLRKGGFAYGDDVRMAFVHHTAGSNDYRCKEAPKVIRGIYRYHVKSLGWRDIGYNFVIDKCGTIYEGRAGGVTEPVRGAHTLGFNNTSMGVAVLGHFGKEKPSKKATDAIAKLTAWKLGLYGVNAEGTTRMTSEGGKYSKGTKVKMRTVSGHRDGYSTACPGEKLYAELPDIRDLAARLQDR